MKDIEKLFEDLSLGKDDVEHALQCTEKLDEIIGQIRTTLIILAITEQSNDYEGDDEASSPPLAKQYGMNVSYNESLEEPASSDESVSFEEDVFECAMCGELILYGDSIRVKHCL